MATTERTRVPDASVREVFRVFLRLGITSFGGPIAHLGYFRQELVLRRKWIDEAGYADLVALCQFLPGPASSQVGFSLGLLRAGPLGGLAAWTGFTLPSALLLVLFAYGAGVLQGPIETGLLHGLKLVAVAIVAQAVWGMARSLAPDRERAGIAAAALVVVTLVAGAPGQIAAICLGGLAGLWLCRNAPGSVTGQLTFPISRRAGIVSLLIFFLLLVLLPALATATRSHALGLMDAFYRSGALVFGGGHVVLPLLQAAVVGPGWIGPDAFLAGYGAAQAVPGPLFSFGAYLGAAMPGQPNGVVGAAICLVALFLPGILILVGTLPFWDALRTRPMARAGMQGVNAAVVGLLGAALYSPIWTSAVTGPYDFALATIGFVLLTVWKAPPWVAVVLVGSAGTGLSLLHL